MGKIRMQDIAERVGVSAVTVYNALTGQKGVSSTLRERIVDTAREMGYYQEQKKGRLTSIGVLIAEKWVADYVTFYWKMYMEVSLAAPDKNCMVTAEILKREAEEKLELPRFMRENAVEGLIVMGEIDRRYINSLKDRGKIPVIFLDFYDKEIAADAVVSDGFHGMYMMTEYLYDKGFRQMAYVGSIHATSSIMDRFCGFQRALLMHDIPLPQEWVIEDRCEVIKLPEKLPEAFVCNCDLTACKVIGELEKRGCRVPEDVSVVGYDNYYLYPDLPDRKITTYEVDMKEMAEVALGKVLKRIENPDAAKKLNLITGHIVEKETVRFSN